MFINDSKVYLVICTPIKQKTFWIVVWAWNTLSTAQGSKLILKCGHCKTRPPADVCGTPDEDIWVKPREQNQLSEIILGYIQPVVVKTYFWRQYRSAPLPSYGRHRKCRNDEDGLQSLVSRHLPAVCRTAPGCCPAPLPDPAPGQRLLGQRCRRIPPPPRVRTDPAGRGAPLLTPALSALTGQPRRGPGGSPLSRRFPGGGWAARTSA